MVLLLPVWRLLMRRWARWRLWLWGMWWWVYGCRLSWNGICLFIAIDRGWSSWMRWYFLDRLLYFFSLFQYLFLYFHGSVVAYLLFKFAQFTIELLFKPNHFILLALYFSDEAFDTFANRDGNAAIQLIGNLCNNLLLHFLHFISKVTLHTFLLLL